MSSFSGIFDILKETPAMLQHKEIYDEYITNVLSGVKYEELDMKIVEMSTLSLTEQNILCGLSMPDFFTKANLHSSAVIKATTLLKKRSDSANTGVNQVRHSKDYNLNFLSDHEVYLKAVGDYVAIPDPSGVNGNRDKHLRDKIMSGCAGITPNFMNSLGTLLAAEKLTCKYDLRHMLIKGYLYVNDFNLAFSSLLEEREEADMTYNYVNNIDSQQRIAAMVQHQVVIDTNKFTDNELKIGYMMACQYPVVCYTPGSIYSNITMDKDDVLFINSSKVKKIKDYDFITPSEMYESLVNFAVKMDAIDDLREVLTMFRGIPRLASKIIKHTHGTLGLKVPLSMSYAAVFDDYNPPNYYISQYSNYYATTKSLIADVLMGDAYDMSVVNNMLSIGAMGDMVYSKKELAANSPVLQSLLRDYGTKHGDDRNSCILDAWRGVNNIEHPLVYFGALKPYCENTVDLLNNGELDLVRTLNFEITCNYSGDNIWASTRGLEIGSSVWIDKKIKSRNNERVASMLWVMGLQDKMPRIGINRLGEFGVTRFDDLGYEKLALCDGVFDLNHVGYTIKGLQDRTDVTECTMTSLHSQFFEGTRCMVIGGLNHPMTNDRLGLELELDEHHTVGLKPKDEEDMDYLKVEDKLEDIIPPFTPGGGILPKNSVESKKGLHFGNGSKPAKKPRVRVLTKLKKELLEQGITAVETGVGWITMRPAVHDNPGEIVNCELIDVPGDGKCGAHAFVTNLLAHGYTNPEDYNGTMALVTESAGSDDWYDAQDLALLANKLGMGLRLYDKSGDSVNRFDYGTEDCEHIIELLRENGHFQCVVRGGGTSLRVTSTNNGLLNPEESNKVLSRFSEFIY